MITAVADTTLNLGFLTILQDGNSYLGGYLATNQWGRPLEFRLTSAVQPNRVQQVLYAGTLESYVCADLIGKTLVEKTPVDVNLIVTDSLFALDLRLQMETPVAWVAHAEKIETDFDTDPAHQTNKPPTFIVRDIVHCHANYSEDAPRIEQMLDKLTGGIDLSEPFLRIREAMSEARRTGVGKKT